MIDFTTIEYLTLGNARQKKACTTLKALKIFEKLDSYNPILAGTIPIGIDLSKSDLDIICECENHAEFDAKLSELFADKQNFQCNTYKEQGKTVTVANFRTAHFEIEIFGQNLPTVRQRAFRHMIVEYHILNQKGAAFKAQIQRLKAEGLKTEPAFAKLLGLVGDPYEALLKMESVLNSGKEGDTA